MPHRGENKRNSTLRCTKTGGIQPKLNVACFVQSCLTDADFVIFSNYCLIGTRPIPFRFQRVKKVFDFFARFKKRHIFCENRFSRKISLRSSKSLINQAFLMAINPISSGAFAPSSSPATLLSFFCSIVFRQPETGTVDTVPVFLNAYYQSCF